MLSSAGLLEAERAREPMGWNADDDDEDDDEDDGEAAASDGEHCFASPPPPACSGDSDSERAELSASAVAGDGRRAGSGATMW